MEGHIKILHGLSKYGKLLVTQMVCYLSIWVVKKDRSTVCLLRCFSSRPVLNIQGNLRCLGSSGLSLTEKALSYISEKVPQALLENSLKDPPMDRQCFIFQAICRQVDAKI